MSRQTHTLLRVGIRHEAQFYDDEEYLVHSLKTYVVSGLAAGETCVIIATRRHAALLEAQLKHDGIDTAAAMAEGRYITRDAQAVLNQFMVDGLPDESKFQAVVGGLVAAAASQGSGVRAYGEMVALLWAQANLPALIKLEELWNQLAETYSFSLLCGYAMDAFQATDHADAFEQITDCHGSIIPAESFPGANDPAGQTRFVAGLQQKASALRAEIASRQQAIQELQATTAELLAEQERLTMLNQAKDEFISIASHQLRTPATGVKQYIGMVLEGYFGELTPQQTRYITKAYESNERQIKVVNDLLLTAKVDAGNIRLTSIDHDIVQLISDVVDEQHIDIARRGQTIGLELPATLLVRIDPQYMRMVIENLVSNASKYSPDGTEISIGARRVAKAVEISVHDHGIGISRANQLKLYKKFSRIYNDQSVAEGNGLGLYWSKKIVELHGGKLLLASKPGQGSVFTVSLPVS